MNTKKRTAKTTEQQFDLMLDFFENHDVLVSGKLRPSEGPEKIQNLWEQLTAILNSVGSGPQKTVEGWKKTWNEYKSHTKKRARDIKYSQKQTGGGEALKTLSARDERLLGLISRVTIDGLNSVPEPGLMPQQVPSPTCEELDKTFSIPVACSPPIPPESPNRTKRPRSPSPGPSTIKPKSKKKATMKSKSAAERATSAYAEAMAGRNNALANNTEAIKELAASIRLLATAMQAVADSMLTIKDN